METPVRIKCKKVAVALLGYNSKDFLEKFIPSILKTDYEDYTLVYIDNASTDDSVEFVKSNFPSVEIFQIKVNKGFTGGYCNSLPYIDAEYYVLLNSDVEVTPGWLKPIIEEMDKDPSIGAAQPKTLHEPIRDQFDYAGASGGFIDKYGYAFCRGRIFNSIEKDSLQHEEPMEIFWATGACMVVRAELYHNLGGLDNHFYAHMEEIDLSWRIKNAGYKIMVYPNAVVYHVGGSVITYGSFTKFYHNYRNNLVMMFKNLPKGKVFKTMFLRMMLDGVAATRALVVFRFTEFRAIFMAHMHFYSKMKKWKSRRKAAQEHYVKESTTGVYNRSLVWDYFVKKKKKFSDLKF
jgi:GT2 family glycosyltransferase